jgi:hypothetical protein
MPTIISPRDLAATYPPHGDLTPWARVQEYRRVQEYTSQHPDEGSHAVSTALELPRERIRPWVDGDSRPEPVKAIETARDRGWLNTDLETPLGNAWTRLVAWTYAGGSIAEESYRPSWYVRDTDGQPSYLELDVLKSALETIGTTHKLVHREGSRPTRIEPADDPILVGRCLASAGAPVGESNAEHPGDLPEWLDDVNDETRRVFARTYIHARASVREFEPRFNIAERRPDEYQDALAGLFDELSPPGSVSMSGNNIYLRSEAAEAILEN